MARQIFRQAALDRMASPERTDRAVRLVGAPGWLILGAFVIAIGFGSVWAIATEAAVKVAASGLLIDRGGLVEVVASTDGQIETLEIRPGDLVAEGQVVAVLSRAELVRELTAAEAKLADAEERFTRLEGFNAEQSAREERTDTQRLATIAETRAVLEDRKALLEQKEADTRRLVERKVVLRDRLLDAQIAVSDVQERLSALDEEEMRLRLGRDERESERQLKMLDEKLGIEEQQRLIARLNSRLSEQRVVRSTHAGRVVELKLNPGDVIAPGSALATLAPAESDIVALLYVPPADGKRVEPGMLAEIAPTTVEREVYGHMLGEVIFVSPLPATPEGMRRVLQNDQLVSQLSQGGAPIEVRVALKTDAETATGYAWSASQGPARGIGAGALIDGKLVIDHTPLVDLVVPGASKMLGETGLVPGLGAE
ncbi:MAG: NHLP bacteriocin system secretion protein [Pseudomonadota bacterium]